MASVKARPPRPPQPPRLAASGSVSGCVSSTPAKTAAVLGAVLAGAVIAAAALAGFRPEADQPYSFAIYDRAGGLLGASAAADGQWRFKPGAVPDKVAAALVAYEDKRFYLHRGLDPAALVRAVVLNATAGRVVSGGSTLTMQTARILRGNRPRTVPQKIIEIGIALLLELSRPKTRILELYAASAPFGGNVVGLEAASWRYFNRPPETLTWAEAATLAVLPNQPGLVHPGADRERLLLKRNQLLKRLAEHGRLSADELKLSLDEELPDKPWALPRLAPQYLERMKAIGRSDTTLEKDLQERTTAILERASERFAANGIANAAALIIDTASGEILAYCGNTGADRNQSRGACVDIVVAPRSSGSLLKPFLYAALLDSGRLLPTQLVADIPMRIGSYRPENNLPVYLGAVPADEALARSLNIPAVRELRDYGIDPFLELLRNSGFTTLARSADYYGLPLILGGGEVTLEETVRAYAGLMNRLVLSTAVAPPVSASPTTPSASMAPLSPLSAGAVWLTLEALVAGTRPEDEALWRSYASARRIAWKTGTSFGNRDAWAVGTTPRYTVGVWIGNATGEGRPELRSAATAAPVLFAIFGMLPPSDWPLRPDADLTSIDVCAASGGLPSLDCAETTTVYKPAAAPLGAPCPYCRTLSLTPDGRFQATADQLTGEWLGDLPLLSRQFVLPPAMESWYVKYALDYRKPPPWLPGRAGDGDDDLAIVFPDAGARIYIPIEIDGRAGRAIMEAAHRDSGATVYWDIDGDYLGETRDFHQMAVPPIPGRHVLTVTDSRGRQARRVFEVLEAE